MYSQSMYYAYDRRDGERMLDIPGMLEYENADRLPLL
jgi:hypothetical protein